MTQHKIKGNIMAILLLVLFILSQCALYAHYTVIKLLF
jgi:hypothetical protein